MNLDKIDEKRHILQTGTLNDHMVAAKETSGGLNAHCLITNHGVFIAVHSMRLKITLS